MSLFDQRMVLEKELIEKALKDANFHKALLANPKSTIENEFGVTLPDSLQISVHEEQPNHLHVVLPTGGTARFSSPLTVHDFMKRSNVVRYSAAAFRDAAESIATLATVEGLHAHAQSALIRGEVR